MAKLSNGVNISGEICTDINDIRMMKILKRNVNYMEGDVSYSDTYPLKLVCIIGGKTSYDDIYIEDIDNVDGKTVYDGTVKWRLYKEVN